MTAPGTSPREDTTMTGQELAELARRVVRLSPDRRDPHAYHEERANFTHGGASF